jgi:hypothetical protein
MIIATNNYARKRSFIVAARQLASTLVGATDLQPKRLDVCFAPDERTLLETAAMSVWCHGRTHAPQNFAMIGSSTAKCRSSKVK